MKTKKILLLSLALILLLYLIQTVHALQPTPDEFQELTLNISLRQTITSDTTTYIKAILNLLPANDERQETISFENFSGSAVFTKYDNNLTYEWADENNITLGWNAEVKTKFFVSDEKEIKFPLTVSEYGDYKKSSNLVDINDAIIKKANELAAGKTEVHDVLQSIAEFVYTNMTFDEAYVGKKKKASWILENKRGVCAEYTILFIALVRALGIPARYVSGVAYSNIKNDFGNHAWAEVYTDKWVPYDTTYGQFGWLDATHVALSKNFETTPSGKFTYKGGVTVKASEININASILENGQLIKPETDIKIMPVKEEIMNNSFLPIKISIKNDKDSFLPLIVYLTKAPEVEGKNVKTAMIKPFSEKSLFFLTHVPDAAENYVYTATIEARTQFNDVTTSQIKFANIYDFISEEEARTIIDSASEKQDFLSDVEIICDANKTYYYDEQIDVACRIKSLSNMMLYDSSFCFENECSKFDLPISKELNKSFNVPAKKEYNITFTNALMEKKTFFSPNLIDFPNISIISLSPVNLHYSKNNLNLTINTNSICKNLVVKINSKRFELSDVDGEKNFEIGFSGKNALNKKIKVTASCQDLRGRNYEDSKSFDVEISEMPWYAQIWQKILLIFS